jgi:hypothetical protein
MKTLPRLVLTLLFLSLGLSSCDQPPEEDATSNDLDLVAEEDLGPWESVLEAWDDAPCPAPNPAGAPPANFAPALLDGLGCQIWYPYSYQALGTPGAAAFASDQFMTVYYSHMLVATPTNAWAYLDQVPAAITSQFGFGEPTAIAIAAKEGTSGRTLVSMFGFFRGQVRYAGRARLFTGADSSGVVRTRLSVFWAPADSLPTQRCVLQQIEASIACPAGPGCNDATCCAYCADAFAAGLCMGLSCACIP